MSIDTTINEAERVYNEAVSPFPLYGWDSDGGEFTDIAGNPMARAPTLTEVRETLQPVLNAAVPGQAGLIDAVMALIASARAK